MKSVTLVAFIGSWFCSSLTRRLRKSVDEIVLLEDELDDDVEEDVEEDVPVDELVEETVMANSGSRHLCASNDASARGAFVISSANQTDVAPNSGADSFDGIR